MPHRILHSVDGLRGGVGDSVCVGDGVCHAVIHALFQLNEPNVQKL